MVPKYNNGVRHIMKYIRNLSLVLAGFVLGAAVTFTPQIQAAASKLLGSKVGNVLNVKIDDKSIGQGAVINGATYVPLRVAANELGLEVTKVDSKEVILSTGEGGAEVPVNDIPTIDNSEKIKEIQNKITELNKNIKTAKSVLDNKEGALRQIKTSQEYLSKYEQFKDSGSEFYTEDYRKVELEKMNNLQKVLDDAEKNIPIWEQQLAELESQLAELQK
jgi:hypothetical protein